MFQVMCQVLSWWKSSTSVWLELRIGWNQWFWIHLPCFNTPFLIKGKHLTPTLKLAFISTLPLALFLSWVFLGEPWTDHPTPTPGFVTGNLFQLSWRPSNSSCLFKSLKINNNENEASLLKTLLSPKRVARMEGDKAGWVVQKQKVSKWVVSTPLGPMWKLLVIRQGAPQSESFLFLLCP